MNECVKYIINHKDRLNILTDLVQQVGSENPDPGQYGGVHKEDGIFLMQYYTEYAKFLDFMLTNFHLGFTNTMNIGIGAGGEAKCFRDFIPCKNTVIIDNTSYPAFQAHYNRVSKEVDSNLIEIFSSSNSEFVKQRLDDLNMSFDYAFIDGAHEKQALLDDITLFRKYAHKHSIFALHDTTMLATCKDVGTEMLSDTTLERIFNVEDKCGIQVWKILN